jgi:hypothetical protein
MSNSTEHSASDSKSHPKGHHGDLLASSDAAIISSEHYEFLQLNQVGRLSERATRVVDPEEQSLRQFNTELLQKVGDFRKRNLELSASENDLKTKLALQTKTANEKERELTTNFQSEIESLQRKLSERESCPRIKRRLDEAPFKTL